MYLFHIHLLIGSEKYCEMSEYMFVSESVISHDGAEETQDMVCLSVPHTERHETDQ